MKKIFYVLLIAFSSSIVITSCTEDEVTPTKEYSGEETSGGSGSGKL